MLNPHCLLCLVSVYICLIDIRYLIQKQIQRTTEWEASRLVYVLHVCDTSGSGLSKFQEFPEWTKRFARTFPARVAARAAEPEGSTTSPLLWRARHVSLSSASPGDMQVIKIDHTQKVPDLLFCNQNHSINIGGNMLSQKEVLKTILKVNKGRSITTWKAFDPAKGGASPAAILLW